MREGIERSQIEVVLYRRTDSTGFIKVKLRSIARPRLISFKDIDVEGDSIRMRSAVAAVGGALAEYQDEQYGDTHDPEECAKAAADAFDELWSDLESGSSQVH
jgi:hypothetical protein